MYYLPNSLHIPACQVNQMDFRNSFTRHVIHKNGLYESYSENGMAATTRIIHICTGSGTLNITARNAFLIERQ